MEVSAGNRCLDIPTENSANGKVEIVAGLLEGNLICGGSTRIPAPFVRLKAETTIEPRELPFAREGANPAAPAESEGVTLPA
jgi:hypothetical protein